MPRPARTSTKPPAARLLTLLAPLPFMGATLAWGADGKPPQAPQAPAAPSAQAERAAQFNGQIRPLLKQFCEGCHGAKNASGGFNVAAFADVTSVQKDQAAWRKALTQIRERSMPPKGAPHPSAQQHDLLISWLTSTLDNVPEELLPKDPGRVLIHRLSRLEYNNTVRDLLGVDTKPADGFPADGGGGGGFDNNADTLFVPPILMERYLHAAGEILAAAKPERLFIVKPEKGVTKRQAAREIVAHFAIRGFRRPVEAAEVERLMRLYDASVKRGESHEEAVKFALKAVLVSPGFLFRVEQDRPGAAPYRLNDYELASRLSYFLWASMPDETLFQLAAKKRLSEPATLEAQVRRMVASPKSRALAESFAGQWLRARDLYTVSEPDRRRFPTYTPSLRDAMFNETVEFFHSLLREDASLLRLLGSDYTYLNEELAKHYGIEGVRGPEMRRVALTDRRRGGVLTMASVLTLTSYPQRTSPVLRGKWVLEEILGAPSPPPPPNAGGLPADDAPREGLTFRQRLEKHREKPECATCHSRMDPIGFGMENFDAVGRWREEIGGKPVDSSGVLAGGEKFSGPLELKRHILEQKEAFLRNLTEKMLAYALGRGLEPYDIPAVKKITAALVKEGCRSSVLLREVVKSYPFLFRRNG